MKKIILSFTLATYSLLAAAQQDPQFTQWQFNKLSFNPAAAGMDRVHNATFLHRDQWDGLDRDPKSYVLNYDGMYGAKKNIGVGAHFLTEVLGQQQNTAFRLNGSYHMPAGSSFFSAGLSLGMYGSKLGGNWVYIDSGDPSIPTNEKSQNKVDIGLGFMLYQPGKYHVGLSSTHLNSAELDDLGIKVARHYYISGGYELPLGSSLTLRPNALIKTDATSTQFDINADVLWNNMLWAGAAFRPGDAIAPFVGFQSKFIQVNNGTKVYNHGIKLGYAYDVTTSAISDYSAGSHEIFLTYWWSVTDIPIRARHSNPRFL